MKDAGVRTRLPMKEFVCKCALSIGVATRPEEYVYGATILQVDDEVLLMRIQRRADLLPSREDGGAAVSLFPLISEPDTGELTGSDGLPLYREGGLGLPDEQTRLERWKPRIRDGGRAVLVWAWNALHTMRFNHDVFSTDYGLDGNTLLGQAYSGEVRESEAIRIVRETLQVNPYITNGHAGKRELRGLSPASEFQIDNDLWGGDHR